MKNLLLLTSACFLYALANGFVAIATPQAALMYGMSSQEIGLLGAAGPAGYAIGCIGLGQLFRGLCGKRILLWGVAVSTLAIAGIANYKTVWPMFAAQLAYGIAQGAVWPFLSAWMLDFQSDSIPRTRILRCYNAGWTSGAGMGLLLAGFLCGQNWIIASFHVGALCNALTCIGALLAAPPHSHRADRANMEFSANAQPARTFERIGFAIFLAAVLANIGALSTSSMIAFNYPELNKALGFGAERMGIFRAVCLGGQLLAFVFGALYEPYLGRRRVYTILAAVLIAVSLACASVTSMALLMACNLLCGLVLAMAFQAALLAATEWFTDRRNGTTIHEGIVGVAQALPYLAGMIAQHAKNTGVETIPALRLPFLLMPGVLGAFLVVQWLAVSRTKTRRMLLPVLPPALPPAALPREPAVATASGRFVT